MRLRLQWLCLALAALLALAAPAHGQSAGRPQVDAGIREIKKYGNLVLDLSGSALLAQGFDYGDIITATLGGVSLDMPVCREYSDADVGAPVCRVTDDGSADGSTATLAINGGDLATWLGIATAQTPTRPPATAGIMPKAGAPTSGCAWR